MKNSKKILVAEDDKAIIMAVKMILEDEGYKVATIMNGDIFDIVVKEKPDLILLDNWLVGENGLEICKKLKSSDSTKDIPVIFFSANKDVQKLMEEGKADDFIEKPFNIELLLNKVAKNLKLV